MSESTDPFTAQLLLTCQDRPGIVAAVSGFFAGYGANITSLNQRATQPEGGTLFLRLKFQHRHLHVSRERLFEAFQQQVAARFAMKWHITYLANFNTSSTGS